MESDGRMSLSPEEIVHQNIHCRRSVGLLVEPAPTQAQLDTAFAAAWVAPDHRNLKPTRFVVVNNAQRESFGDALAQSYQKDTLKFDDVQFEKLRQQPFRAPMIVIAITEIQYHEKVPEFEQLLSTGAAIQNFLLSLQAQGFSTMWRTGELVKSESFKKLLSLDEKDYISGIIYIGTEAKGLPPRKSEMKNEFVTFWKDASSEKK